MILGYGNDWRAERDLLDWVYLSSRVMLLASVVYFYGSVARLVLVSCVAILLYFYQVNLSLVCCHCHQHSAQV